MSNNKRKVLIIDDQEGIRRVFSEICLMLGYETATAFSGDNALVLAASEIADGNEIRVAFVDMKMPGMSGFDTLKGLHTLIPNIKIYLMTGFVEESLDSDAVKYGVCAIIQKPFGLEEIKEILEESLS